MIKVIIFDLDGVLVDTKLIHFKALNLALKKYKINEIKYEDHIKIYDGLPTFQKLDLITKKKKIPKKNILEIQRLKQVYTKKLLKDNVLFNKKVNLLFKKLSKKYKIAVATNAVRSTLNICLKNLKIKKYINYSICNEEVNNSKPNPEIYFKIFMKFGIYPDESIILEDSHYGRKAATYSGGNLVPIQNLNEVNLKNVNYYIKMNNKIKMINDKNLWEDKNLNILIPMAGAGKRFADAGYIFPKPLIEINNKPMIQIVLDSLNLEFICFIVLPKPQTYSRSS